MVEDKWSCQVFPEVTQTLSDGLPSMEGGCGVCCAQGWSTSEIKAGVYSSIWWSSNVRVCRERRLKECGDGDFWVQQKARYTYTSKSF